MQQHICCNSCPGESTEDVARYQRTLVSSDLRHCQVVCFFVAKPCTLVSSDLRHCQVVCFFVAKPCTLESSDLSHCQVVCFFVAKEGAKCIARTDLFSQSLILPVVTLKQKFANQTHRSPSHNQQILAITLARQQPDRIATRVSTCKSLAGLDREKR